MVQQFHSPGARSADKLDKRFAKTPRLSSKKDFGESIIITRGISAMAVNPSQRLKVDTAVVSLTTVQSALWQLGMPILDAVAVAEYKKRAKLQTNRSIRPRWSSSEQR